MRNKCGFFVVPLIAALMFSNITVFAENKEENITADRLVEEIYVNLIEYREIELNNKRSKLDDYTIKNSLNEAERQLESNDKNIEQMEIRLNSSGTSSEEKNQCRYQIEYLKIYGFELQKNKCYYEMQNKLSELYEEYSDKIVQGQQNKLKYETYKTLCEIKIYELQEEYLQILVEQKKDNLDVIRESLEIGYATENDVFSSEAEYESVKSELTNCENNYTTLVNRIENESGNKLSTFSSNIFENKDYESEKYLKQFKQQSFYSEYYLKQSEIYGEYSKLLNELTKQMNNEYKQNQYRFLFKDNEDFWDRTYKYISDEKNYYGNESEIYKLNSGNYSAELELYITESCGNLNTLLSRRTAKLAAIRAAESSYTIAKELFKEGRINKLNLSEAQINLQKVKYELSEIEVEILIIKFALENNVEI